jgi:hypothetical protein
MPMRRCPFWKRRVTAALLGGSLLCAPALADDTLEEVPFKDAATLEAEEAQAVYPGDVLMDVLVVRPFAFVGTAVGAILFVPAAALASPGGMDKIETALDQFVLVPWEYAAERPLGEF